MWKYKSLHTIKIMRIAQCARRTIEKKSGVDFKFITWRRPAVICTSFPAKSKGSLLSFHNLYVLTIIIRMLYEWTSRVDSCILARFASSAQAVAQMSLQSEFACHKVVTELHRDSVDSIFIPIGLPCGRSVQNRLVKVCVPMEHVLRLIFKLIFFIT